MSRRRRSLRYRPESTRPSVVIVSAVIGLITATIAVGCAWLFVSTIVAGIGPLESVGVARPTPAWLALVGVAIGAVAAAQVAWDSATYLVRVIRKRPKLILRRPDEPGRSTRRSRDPRRSGDPRRRART